MTTRCLLLGWQIRLWGFVRPVVGMLLLLTAGLKLAGMGLSAVPLVGWFSLPSVQLATGVWEILLGCCLLCGAYQVGTWLAAFGTFTAFMIISAYQGWTGVAYCACFGAVNATPWWAFGLDVAVLACLLLARPSFSSLLELRRNQMRESGFRLGRFALAFAVLLSGVILLGVATKGTFTAALANLRGETLSVQPSYVDFGVIEPGQTLQQTVRVHNWTSRTVRIFGARSDGPAILTDDMPAIVAPGGSAELTVRLRVGSFSDGAFLTRAELWAEDGEIVVVPITLGCRVRSLKPRSESQQP